MVSQTQIQPKTQTQFQVLASRSDAFQLLLEGVSTTDLLILGRSLFLYLQTGMPPVELLDAVDPECLLSDRASDLLFNHYGEPGDVIWSILLALWMRYEDQVGSKVGAAATVDQLA